MTWRQWRWGAVFAACVLVGTLSYLPRVAAVPELQRATLPPTWTPTPTHTAMPSRTPTLTPTITPTLTAEEVCAGFLVLGIPDNGFSYPLERGRFEVILATELPNSVIRALFRHRLTGENIGGQIEGAPSTVLSFPINRLPHPGLYDWTIALVDANAQTVCSQSGYFFVRLPGTATPIPSPSATPNIVYIVVTATPE
ncbi:MAG: hypothetical protein ACOYL5_17810 [Phototrophicaceae bacterium]